MTNHTHTQTHTDTHTQTHTHTNTHKHTHTHTHTTDLDPLVRLLSLMLSVDRRHQLLERVMCRYIPYRNASERWNHPIPLFVVLHGFTSSPETVANDSMMAAVADELGFAVAFPKGVDAGYGEGWAFPGCNSVPPIGQTDNCGRQATCSGVGCVHVHSL
jgi:S-formylglutathione hydrolase FrmB